MFVVYAIASIQRKYVYVGLTSNLEQRLLRHNNKLEKTTKPYAPFTLIYSEIHPGRPAARNREKFFKSRSGKRTLYRIITNEFPLLSQYLN